MKHIKIFLIAFFLVFFCFVLVSCGEDDTSSETKSDTEAVEVVNFEETENTDRLFDFSDYNFFDVTDFSINKANEFGIFTSVVNFSYQPHELRSVYNIVNPYIHQSEDFDGLFINSDHVTACLQLIGNTVPIRTLKPDSDKESAVTASFSKSYGVEYSLSFTHNAKRNSDLLPISDRQTHYDFLISPKTKDNTYYLYDKNTLTLYEISEENLSFVEGSPESWYDTAIFMYHIAIVKKIEIFIKPETNTGVSGELTLEHYFTDKNGTSLNPAEVISSPLSDTVLHASVNYNGGAYKVEDVTQYRDFYKTLLLSDINEIDFSRVSTDIIPEMKMTVYLEYDNERKTLEYSFFSNDYVMLNGKYIGKLADGQVDTIISAVGPLINTDAEFIKKH